MTSPHQTEAPVFFSEHVSACIEGKSLDEALDALAALILEASADKEAGYGPPQDDLNKARRKWLDMYEQHRSAA